jgi:D-threonate/D-erythronate kinase
VWVRTVDDARWLIIADDLTGAADSAIAFARRGLRTRVVLQKDWFVNEETMVAAFDADTRRLSATEAASRHAQAMRRYAAPDAHVFKKIDSTLRGNLAAEVAAMREVLAEHQRETFGVLAPAFPAMGRTTRDGRVFVHGKPLEESETWKREHAYPNADLGDILAGAGLMTVKVPLSSIRAGIEPLRNELRRIAAERAGDGHGQVAICDAETDGDLDCITAAFRSGANQAFVVGTAGLAHAIARSLPVAPRAQYPFRQSHEGALIVVGSLASVSRDAAAKVAALPGVVHLRIGARTLLAPDRVDERVDASGDAIRALETGRDVLVELLAEGAPNLALGPRLVIGLAVVLSGAMRTMSGLIVTGGETAAALLAEIFVNEIELLDETERGVCLGVARSGLSGFPVVTKAGAFGDSGSLVRALEKLRMIRKSGILA